MYRRFCPYNTFVARSPTFSFVPMCAVRDSPTQLTRERHDSKLNCSSF